MIPYAGAHNCVQSNVHSITGYRPSLVPCNPLQTAPRKGLEISHARRACYRTIPSEDRPRTRSSSASLSGERGSTFVSLSEHRLRPHFKRTLGQRQDRSRPTNTDALIAQLHPITRGLGPVSLSIEPFAMVPRTWILGTLVPGDSQSQAMALHLLCFLDHFQRKDGYAVGGYRYVSVALGWQPRTVSKYAKALEKTGVLKLTTRQEGKLQSVRMKVERNGSRWPERPSLSLSPHPSRAAHKASGFRSPLKEHQMRDTHSDGTRPSAPDASPPSSPRSGLLKVVPPALSDEPRCARCAGLLSPPLDYETETRMFCDCPFEETHR